MTKTTFKLHHMDCPSEEQMVRMALSDSQSVKGLEFDLNLRQVAVYHQGDSGGIGDALRALGLGMELVVSESATVEPLPGGESADRRLLAGALAINAFFFFAEMGFGLFSRSMGLVADSLDMLADAFVYGLSLWAVGASLRRKRGVAAASGWLQLALGLLGAAEVLRRVFFEIEPPDYWVMTILSLAALAGNAATLMLLSRSRSKEAHVRASMIFTSNDVLINIGVIISAGLVAAFQSRLPDLAVGAVVFVLVVKGAADILRLACVSPSSPGVTGS